jgi:hypothetical protein
MDAEIREVEELRILEVDPDEWHHAGDRVGLSLEEYIAASRKGAGAMLRRLAGRVGRLEIGRTETCPVCGWDGDWSKLEYLVDSVDADGSTKPDESCGTCGFQLTYVVLATWDDTPNLTVPR